MINRDYIEIHYEGYRNDAYQLIDRIARFVKNGSHEINLYYEGYDVDKEMDTIEKLDVHHISFLDYYYLKKAFQNISKQEKEWYQVIDIYYDEYTPQEITDVRLHEVDAGPYISGRSGVKGNRYLSECDTYGPYYYTAYFLYQPELDRYIKVVEKNYAV